MLPSSHLPVDAAARELGVTDARVRALLRDEQLVGEKVGGRWLVRAESVRRRQRETRRRGRQLNPANAWAMLFLASGLPVTWVRGNEYSRLLRLLDEKGLEALVPRLHERASLSVFAAHPGVLRHLADDTSLVLSGVSAAGEHKLGLVSGQELDGYVRASLLAPMRSSFALAEDGQPGNVKLRVVPDEAWHLQGRHAPLAAVAIDLAGEAEPRSARAGKHAVSTLDSEQRWRLFSRPRGRPRRQPR